MKTRFLIALLLLLGCVQVSIAMNSELSNVRLFLWGAEITRKASVQVIAGNGETVFTGLPADINPSSIQVKPTGEFTILSVGHRLNFQESPILAAELKILRDSLDLLKDLIDRKQASLKVFEEEEALLLANRSIGGTQDGVKLADLRAIADFFRNRLSEVKNFQINVRREIEQLQQRQTRIRQQVGQLGNQRMHVSEIVVATSAPRAVRGQFEISFITYQANWNPVYDLRATDTGRPIDLIMKARITQSTGEDWNNLRLLLSTANPIDNRVAPTLNPWFLNFIEPMPVMHMRSRGMEKMQFAPEMEVMDVQLNEMIAVGSGPQTIATQTATTREFQITTPHTIKTGQATQTIEISKHELPATFTWFAVPRVDKDAYLLARNTGWEEFIPLAGNAGIFFENTFVGETFINPDQATDTLTLSMGTDRGVIVERVRQTEFARKGVLGRRVTETVAWQIRARNNKNRSVNLEIRDQIPVSAQSDIQVTLEESSGAEYEQSTGMLIWRMEVPAGQTQNRTFRYSVRYPSDKKIRLE